MSTVRPVLAGQSANPYFVQTGLDMVNAVYGEPSRYFHGTAGAPYFNLGNLQRIWKTIQEENDQGILNVRFPFEAWGEEGYVKIGGFHDQVDREFDPRTEMSTSRGPLAC